MVLNYPYGRAGVTSPAEQGARRIVIMQGVDFTWQVLVAHTDGTIKNFTDWTGRFNVYPDGDTTAAPVVTLTTQNFGMALDLQGSLIAGTTLSGAHTAGDDTITVASATDMAVGDTITVVMDDVAIHHTTIAAIAGTTVTLQQELTDPAVNGAVVQCWDERYMVTNVTLYMSSAQTGALTPWGVGLYDLDLIDPYGRKQRYFGGECVLQEGTV